MELERIYALYGVSNSGKTSTLNQLINILRYNAEKVVLDENVGGTDHRAVFLIKGKYVGVSTQGDCESQVRKHLDVIEPLSNIIFCATRTRGGTCHHVAERFGNKLTWIQNFGIYNKKKYAFDNSAFIEASYSSIGKMLFELVP
ncbi:ATP-binding protein [Vibrio parahaemolyticus]|nr:ATP-binding protein [Vibrio parahaemolyticus]ELA7176996.1 ATP-binding protein [Vibrio parahaemolyticus]ELA7459479.1 ATP-binding protein [Vibrio parahaemolyticus]ELA7483229.1 ATP-binding protein [Vibrio parahaemolyticus]ELA7905927.1 ATP-binding protein [Vibrio parahaemolyticus]